LDVRYDQLINDCYWNYQRIYAPAGSILESATSEPVPASLFVSQKPWDGVVRMIPDPTGLSVMANFILVKRGENVSVNYDYTLPQVAVRLPDGTWRYRLELIKQPGARSQPVLVRVDLPPASEIIAASPGIEVSPGAAVFEGVLDRDLTLEITYR
jgi:hypothetical protein